MLGLMIAAINPAMEDASQNIQNLLRLPAVTPKKCWNSWRGYRKRGYFTSYEAYFELILLGAESGVCLGCLFEECVMPP